MSYNLDANHLAEETGQISYAFIQALPKMGRFNFYPLAGVGAAFGNNVIEDDGSIDSGFSTYGAYAMVGMYSRLTITDKIWMNYNPFYLSALAGSDNYLNNAYGADSGSVLTHEVSIGYKISPRLNVRYFANWSENNSFSKGDHRIDLTTNCSFI